MSAYATNVVRLIPRQIDQVERAKHHSLEIDKDRQSLADLSRYLRSLRQDLVEETLVLDDANATATERSLKLQTAALIEQVEALEASMSKLIAAMTTHQAR
jgi:hypothetical protein